MYHVVVIVVLFVLICCFCYLDTLDCGQKITLFDLETTNKESESKYLGSCVAKLKDTETTVVDLESAPVYSGPMKVNTICLTIFQMLKN